MCNDGPFLCQSNCHSGANDVYVCSVLLFVASFFQWLWILPNTSQEHAKSMAIRLPLQQRCQVGSKVGDDAIEEAMVADVVATGPITLSVPTGRFDGKLMEVRRLCGKVNHIPFLLPFNQDPVANPLIPITLTIRDSILTNVTSYCNFRSACMCSTRPSSPVWVPHLRRLHIRKQHTRIRQQSIVLGDRQ